MFIETSDGGEDQPPLDIKGRKVRCLSSLLEEVMESCFTTLYLLCDRIHIDIYTNRA